MAECLSGIHAFVRVRLVIVSFTPEFKLYDIPVLDVQEKCNNLSRIQNWQKLNYYSSCS